MTHLNHYTNFKGIHTFKRQTFIITTKETSIRTILITHNYTTMFL